MPPGTAIESTRAGVSPITWNVCATPLGRNANAPAAGLEAIRATDDLEPPFEHVEGLVLVVVDVQRRTEADGQQRLHDEELSAGRAAARLERELAVGEPDPLALSGAERDRLTA